MALRLHSSRSSRVPHIETAESTNTRAREGGKTYTAGGNMQSEQGTAASETIGEGAAAGEIKDKPGRVVEDAKNAAGQFAEGLKSKAETAVAERKDTAAQTLGTVAGALRGAAQELENGEVAALGQYAQSAAQQIDKVAGYLREKDLTGLKRDTETFARRHPEVFLGGAFLAGILAARFLKSSRPPATPGEGAGYEGGFAGGYPAGPQTYAGGAQTEPFNPPHFSSTGGQ
jgi:hypothetical protein